MDRKIPAFLIMLLFTACTSGYQSSTPPAPTSGPITPTVTIITPPPTTVPYTDSNLNFSLRYPTSWTLEAHHGTNLNDGSGKTIHLERAGYLVSLVVQPKPEDAGECGGLFQQTSDSPENYWHYQTDGIALWRPKLEAGFTDGYADGSLTFAGIISPTRLYDTPDANGYVGEFTCALEINNRIFSITYRLPVSLEAIQAGQYRADLLAEMDDILQSIQFNLPSQTCQVTLPAAPPFIPPSPYPSEPPGAYFWYGDESLWTALPPHGIWSDLPHNPTGYTQKLLWWRVGYVWTEEPKPALQVTGRRLDDPTVTLLALPATNAFAPDIQSAMLVGVDFPTLGCWEITGRYADAQLSYIVQIEP